MAMGDGRFRVKWINALLQKEISPNGILNGIPSSIPIGITKGIPSTIPKCISNGIHKQRPEWRPK